MIRHVPQFTSSYPDTLQSSEVLPLLQTYEKEQQYVRNVGENIPSILNWDGLITSNTFVHKSVKLISWIGWLHNEIDMAISSKSRPQTATLPMTSNSSFVFVSTVLQTWSMDTWNDSALGFEQDTLEGSHPVYNSSRTAVHSAILLWSPAAFACTRASLSPMLASASNRLISSAETVKFAAVHSKQVGMQNRI